MTKIHSIYDAPPKVPFECTGESMTKQAHKDECDINRIVSRYERSGVNPFAMPQASYGGEIVEVGAATFHEAMGVVASAGEAFEALPSHMRKRFNNSPHELLAFLGDAKNLDEAVRLGLVEAPPEPVEVAPAPSPV